MFDKIILKILRILWELILAGTTCSFSVCSFWFLSKTISDITVFSFILEKMSLWSIFEKRKMICWPLIELYIYCMQDMVMGFHHTKDVYLCNLPQFGWSKSEHFLLPRSSKISLSVFPALHSCKCHLCDIKIVSFEVLCCRFFFFFRGGEMPCRSL